MNAGYGAQYLPGGEIERKKKKEKNVWWSALSRETQSCERIPAAVTLWQKVYYRKRGSASYIVREVHSVREREIQREKDGSDVTIVALKLAMSFALLLAKNVHLSIGEEFCAFPCQKNCTSVFPLRGLNGAEFTLSVAKNVALFETVRILRTVTWRDWQAIEAGKQTIEFPAAPFFFIVEKKSQKWIKLIPKTIGNRKRDCAWGCAWGINTTWENLQIEKHKSGRPTFCSPNWFVLFDLQIFSGGCLFPKRNLTHNLFFLFPIVFGIN